MATKTFNILPALLITAAAGLMGCGPVEEIDPVTRPLGPAMMAAAELEGETPEDYPEVNEPCRGYTLFGTTVEAQYKGQVTLIDMAGQNVRTWEGLNGFPAKMLPGGSIMATKGMRPGLITSWQDSIELVQVDWDGKTEWSFKSWDNDKSETMMSRQHHDYQREGSPTGYYAPGQEPALKGKTLVLAHKERVVPNVSRLPIDDDVLYEVTADGKLTRKAGALPVKHDYVDGAAADLDNDGLADLVLVSPKKTSLLLSDTLAPGTFRDASTQLPSTGVDQATGVAIGHLDGNAHLDVVLARGDTSAATNTVLYNDTAGLARFSRQGTQPADKARTGAVAVADMTGDVLGEIVFGNTSSATVVYSPTLQKKLNKVYTVPKSSSGGVLDLLAVDLDNDCDVDLVLARDAGIRVLLNKGKDKTGKPTFSESALGSAALPARSLAAVDVTGDGLNDLLLGGDKIGANWLYQK